MRLLQDVEDQGSLREIVTQDLKELGIKLPKHKKSKTKEEQLDADGGVFGTRLRQVPSLVVDSCGMVPRFLVEATSVLEQHLEMEGIFRKSGSVARQKELKDRIELGDALKEGHPYDVASLMKQFFRELPDPLLTSRLHDTFLKVNALETEGSRHVALLRLCLLLPPRHLTALRFTMCFLARVARRAAHNKMETSNLAVCMAPNLLNAHGAGGGRAEINSESKLLHAQTQIVELLICHAEEIGRVPDELYERACLMSCFQSEDELERSEDMNDSKPPPSKKKKKRSGSLQGLVTNLSNSFSKWRRDGRGHNASSLSDKSSMISYTSYDQVDMTTTSQTSDELSPPRDMHHVMLSDVTPKVMRKRKASGEMVAFSATKKKAILQNMPQMSALGNTPFTPIAKRPDPGAGYGLPPGTPTSAVDTPRRKIDKLLSPGSATKVKRHTSAKAGCFSPKTSKSGKRRSFKGLLRRLSGGKDQASSSSSSSSTASAHDLSGAGDMGRRLAHPGAPPEQLIILPPPPGDASGKDGAGLRRHAKTPSSPARLLAPDLGLTGSDATPPEVTSAHAPGSEQRHLHRRGFSSDGGALRRGRPNTVAVGLPVPNRRSLDRSLPVPVRHSSQKQIFVVSPSAIDTSPIAKMGSLAADELSSPGALSPVRAAPGAALRREDGSASSLGTDEEEHDRAFIQDSTMMDNAEDVPVSTLGDNSDAAHVSPESATTLLDDQFKKPFLTNAPTKKREVIRSVGSGVPPTTDDLDVTNMSVTSESSVCTVIFNGKPVPSSKVAPPVLIPRKTDKRSVSCEQSSKSDSAFTCTAERESSSKESETDTDHVGETGLEGHRGQKLVRSASSLDSGIDQSEEDLRPHGSRGAIDKSQSVSVSSLDSGFGCAEENNGAGLKARQDGGDSRSTSPLMDSVPLESEGNHTDKGGVTSLPDAGANVSAFSRATARAQSFRASREGAAPVLLRRGSVRRPAAVTESRDGGDAVGTGAGGAEITMPVSAEMHHMLARVGVVGDEKAVATAPFVALASEESGDPAERSGKVRESVLNLQHAAVVSAGVREFDRLDRELASRRASPLRFTNSVTRNRGVSPVRIPSVFARSDAEPGAYKDVKKSLLRSPAKLLPKVDETVASDSTGTGSAPPSGGKARPLLPISTALLRNDSIQHARRRLGAREAEEATRAETRLAPHRPLTEGAVDAATKRVTPPGSPSAANEDPEPAEGDQPTTSSTTPEKLFGAKVRKIELNQSLLETIEQCCTPVREKMRKEEAATEPTGPLADSTNTKESSAAPGAVGGNLKMKGHLLSKEVRDKLLAKGLNTPRLRKGLDSPTRRRGAQATGSGAGARVRSPVKPVKRLQGSPRSPRASAHLSKSPGKFNMAAVGGTGPGAPSPGKVTKRGTLSPIPNHVTDWNI